MVRVVSLQKKENKKKKNKKRKKTKRRKIRKKTKRRKIRKFYGDYPSIKFIYNLKVVHITFIFGNCDKIDFFD